MLHDRGAPGLFHGDQAKRAIVQGAGQDHTDNALAVVLRGRAEQWIDGRAKAIFPRSARDSKLATVQDEMVVRWREINLALLKCLAVYCKAHGQAAGSFQNLRQRRTSLRRR